MDDVALVTFSRFGVVRSAPVEKQAAIKEQRHVSPPAKKQTPRVAATGVSLGALLNSVVKIKGEKVVVRS